MSSFLPGFPGRWLVVLHGLQPVDLRAFPRLLGGGGDLGLGGGCVPVGKTLIVFKAAQAEVQMPGGKVCAATPSGGAATPVD